MNKPIHTQLESSKIITKSDFELPNDRASRQVTTTDGNIKFADFNITYRPSNGTKGVDELILDLQKEDPSFSKEMSEARKFVSATYFKNKSRIKSLRLDNGWSQAELAKLMGTSQPHIARIEAGTEDQRLSTIRKLAGIFKKPTSELIQIFSTET